MQTRNDYDKGVFNGHIGIVEEIEFGHAATLWVRFDEMRVSYTWDELKDLSLGYAITVHKAQGSEFPIVIMPVFWGERSQVSRHLIYTAVTRAKEQVILVGRKMDLTRGIRNDRSARRVTRLVNKLTKN
jgi:exodeoxyribonuclease V alpha subunit